MKHPIRVIHEENLKGRDFVVGDLHGSFSLFQTALDAVQFNPLEDRVFSVGDLTDRGPDSLKCLRLINEPWFFAVRGNHENMMVVATGGDSCDGSRPRDFTNNGGGWLFRLTEAEKNEAVDLIRKINEEMPFMRTVKHKKGDFDIIHAELGWSEETIPTDVQIDELMGLDRDEFLATQFELIQSMTWGRDLIAKAFKPVGVKKLKEEMLQSTEFKKPYIPGNPWKKGKRLTYVGHTILNRMVLAYSHFYLDTGAYKKLRADITPQEEIDFNFRLTLLEHGKLILPEVQ